MTKRECIAALDGLSNPDEAPAEAVDLLLEWLDGSGHADIAKAFRRVGAMCDDARWEALK